MINKMLNDVFKKCSKFLNMVVTMVVSIFYNYGEIFYKI